MCELLHTRTPGIASQCFLAAACGGNSMNNLSQPPQPTEPDMALLYLGSLFETLDYTLPPERDEAKLDALAWHILDKRPKTLLGLAIRARAEKHLCRYLWTVDFERLPPSDQAACVVIECAMLLSSRPCDRGESRAQSKTPPRGIAGRRDSVLGTTRGSSGLQPSRTALASSWRVRNARLAAD
jgi:hypothetical protein